MVGKYIKMHLEYLKIAASTAMEYRINFFTQVFGMFINDIIWLLFWFILFGNFNTIAGWTFKDMILLWSILTVSYGIGGFLFGNRTEIASLISDGKLDFYLTLPKNALYHVLVSKSSFYSLGDFIFGIVVAFFVLSVSQIPLYVFLVVACSIILVSFAVIINSLAFFMGDSRQTSNTIWMSMIGVASYPTSIFSGAAKVIIYTIIPAAFISGVPVSLIKSFNLQWFLIFSGFTILITVIAIFVFYFGLRKYESGNSGFVRM